MGTKDIETAIFFDDDRRYADLLNGYIFDGKQVIMEIQEKQENHKKTVGVYKKGKRYSVSVME
jgi:hypothetical protein